MNMKYIKIIYINKEIYIYIYIYIYNGPSSQILLSYTFIMRMYFLHGKKHVVIVIRKFLTDVIKEK